MGYSTSILDFVGNTPVVQLTRVAKGLKPTILAKLEQLNPGGSVKDRIGLAMIEAAEKSGKLTPGGTIIEPTSGNTGHGLAIAACLKGYRCVFVMPDKMSAEKIRLLEAYGAEVVICPTAVERDDPRSYYSVADHLEETIPGAYQPNQYFNEENPKTHYATTGPEIWKQTDGHLTAFVAGVGTGGTISGIGKYLKEKSKDVLIVGADPEGSIYTGDVHPYLIEGVGEDFYPGTFDRSVVDRFIQVGDHASFEMTRRLAREEGILVGGSGGMALVATLEIAAEFDESATILVLLPDTGRNYLSKVYSNEWMTRKGFLVKEKQACIGDLLIDRSSTEPPLIFAETDEPLSAVIAKMELFNCTYLPVFQHDPSRSRPVGAVSYADITRAILEGTIRPDSTVRTVLTSPLPTVEDSTPIAEAQTIMLSHSHIPLVVVTKEGTLGVLTLFDLTVASSMLPVPSKAGKS